MNRTDVVLQTRTVYLLLTLSSSKAQNLFADVNMEYPINLKVAVHPSVAGWGGFKASQQNLVIAGLLQDAAIRLMARADYL
jgi:iron(III) transport system substrate-binding protein